MPYYSFGYDKGTGLSFIPYQTKYDILTFKSQYTSLSSSYTNTSNLTDNLRLSYSNLSSSYLATSNLGDNLRGSYSNLSLDYTTLNNKYTFTSNVVDNLRTGYSNIISSGTGSFDGKYNGNVLIYTKSDGIQVNSNLYVDSNLNIDNTVSIYNNSTEKPSLTIMNGETYTLMTKTQIRFSYFGEENFASHFLHTTHSGGTATRNRMDFILCNGGGSDTSLTTNTINVLSLRGDGRVGIGNTAPTYNLDCTGTGRFTTNLTVGGTASITGTISHGGTLIGGLIDIEIVPCDYGRSTTGTINNVLTAAVISGTAFSALGTKILISAYIKGYTTSTTQYVSFSLQVRTLSGGDFVDSAICTLHYCPTFNKWQIAEAYITGLTKGTNYCFYQQISEMTSGSYDVSLDYVKVYHYA